MADKRRISITEALTELKLYDSKINKAISSAVFVGAKKKSSDAVGFMKVSSFNDNARSGYQSVMDLIQNRNNLKKAIVQSNAVTTVEIAGVTYTVAEAIEKKSSISYLENLLYSMKEQWNKAVTTVDKENKRVDQQVDKMLETFVGKDSEKKISDNDFAAISNPYRDKNEFELVNPLDLYTKIQTLEADIDAFRADVDVRLSISNSVTYIEV